jgi:hypothetical protein
MGYLNGVECFTPTGINIFFDTRLFWREFVYWTRAFFRSVFLGVENTQDVFAKLFYIPDSYAYMLRLILPRHVANEYGELFTRYIIILRELTTAVIGGQTEMINEKVSELYRNSEERAIFLSGVFPSLDKDVLEEMFNTFIRCEIEEINAYVTQDFSRLIEIYDNLIIQMNLIADYISRGIIDLITAAPRGQDVFPCVNYEDLNNILNISMFWIDLVSWFRAYRISVATNIGDQEELFQRLIRVIDDFGNLMKKYIDPAIVDVQMQLLLEYIDLMDRMLTARISGNVEEMNRVYLMTIDNINERAEFLGESFPGLNVLEWRNQLLRMHSLFIDMAGEFLSGNYDQSIAMFDGLIDLAEDMGFLFVDAIFCLCIPGELQVIL